MKLFIKIVSLLLILAFLFFIGSIFFKNLEIQDIPKEVSDTNKNITITLNETFGNNIYSVINHNNLSIYSTEYINATDEAYSQLNSYKYNLKKPLIIYNLYGTNTLSFNIQFSSIRKTYLQYTISVDDPNITNYSNILYNSGKNNLTKFHNYQIIGFVPGYKNTLHLELVNRSGKVVDSKSIDIDLTSISVSSETKLLSENTANSSVLSNGLFAILGNDSTTVDYHFTLYDNNGIIRSVIPNISYRADNLLFKDSIMYYSVAPKKIVAINNLGKIIDVYNLGNYKIHHDYIFDDDGNILILATNTKKDTVEDCIIKIDLKTKEIIEVLDLENLFGSYMKTCEKGAEETLDWIHINSIEYVDGNIIISSRETSSIIKINDIYSNPQINYILSAKELWKKTEFSKFVYKKIGDFQIHGGQHSVKYIPSTEEHEYFLTFYNNNWGNQKTQPDFDYSRLGFHNSFAKGDNSYCYTYKVNEVEKTFKLINIVPVEYSPIVSSVQIMNNENKVINSGCAGVFAEYDSNNNLIKKFNVKLNNIFVYRVYKFDFNNFWFKSI